MSQNNCFSFRGRRRADHFLCLQNSWYKHTNNHDVPNFSSDLLVDIKQTPLILLSEYIFNSHYMFRRSGPGHILLHTVTTQSQSMSTAGLGGCWKRRLCLSGESVNMQLFLKDSLQLEIGFIFHTSESIICRKFPYKYIYYYVWETING